MHSTCRVLVVEDDRPVQKLLHRHLTSWGCQVDLAGDGNEGLMLWERNEYDLVLTDLNMPGLDGSELASRIRRSGRSNAQHVPLIAMTGGAEDARSRFATTGINDCMTKPFSTADLQRVLGPWLPGSGGPPGSKDGGTPGTVHDSDSAIMRHIAGIFITTIPDYLRDLDRACAEDSQSGIRDAAHKLKSAARLVGGNEVATLCEALEGAARHAEMAKLIELAKRIPAAVKALEQSLEAATRSRD